ncbi:hypothetical protein GCM10012320_33870 [Sinomonas cellulolyticus]|nr:hypothetical protein GCM10012320_33870 [Sinomonas sp. KCTC 49339]
MDLRVQALCLLLRRCGLWLGGAAFDPGLVEFLRVRGHGSIVCCSRAAATAASATAALLRAPCFFSQACSLAWP